MRFENACVEFDEQRLAPTYRLLWGIPGRSNALNIAQRLGIPDPILDSARNEMGSQALHINDVRTTALPHLAAPPAELSYPCPQLGVLL